jgi:TonB family protein
VLQCSNGISLETFAKQAIVKDFDDMSVQERTQQEILNNVATYYRVMFAENLAKTVTRYSKGMVTLSFSVTSQGSVINPKVVEAKPLNMRLDSELKKELQTWRFPHCAKQPTPLKVTFSFSY